MHKFFKYFNVLIIIAFAFALPLTIVAGIMDVIENHELVTETNEFYIAKGGSTNNYDSYVYSDTTVYPLVITNNHQNGNDRNNKFDLIIYIESSTVSIETINVAVTISSTTYQVPRYQFVIPSMPEFIEYSDKGFVFTSPMTLDTGSLNVGVSVTSSETLYNIDTRFAVVRYYPENVYITSRYDLEYLDNEYMRFRGENNLVEDIPEVDYDDTSTFIADVTAIEGFKFTYFLDDLTGDNAFSTEFYINYPTSINLLYADIQLKAAFALRHTYCGVFYIKNITGQINNSAFTFALNAINSYFSIRDGVSSIFSSTDPLRLSIAYRQGDLNGVDNTPTATGTVFRSYLTADINAYIAKLIPTYIYEDLYLPNSYPYNRGIAFGYVAAAYTVAGTSGQTIGQTGGYINNPNIFETVGGKITGKVNRPAVQVQCSFRVTYTLPGGALTTRGKNVQILGLDDGSIANGFLNILSTTVSTNLSGAINKQLDLKTMFMNFPLMDKDLSFTIPANSQYVFQVLNYASGTGYVVTEALSNLTIGPTGVISWAQLMSKDYTIIIKTDDYVSSTTASLTVAQSVSFIYGTAPTKTVNFNITAMSLQQREDFVLKQLLGQEIYFSSNDRQDILNIVGNTFNFGITKLARGKLNISSIENKAYIVVSTVYDNIIDVLDDRVQRNQLCQDVIDSVEEEDRIDFYDGTVGPHDSRRLTLSTGYDLILITKVTFADDAGNAHQILYPNQIHIPKDGIGGTDEDAYANGNTFQPYFSSLEDGYLLKNDDYVFSIGSPIVSLYMFIYRVNGEVLPTDTAVSLNASGGYQLWSDTPPNANPKNRDATAYVWLHETLEFVSNRVITLIGIDFDLIPTFDTEIMVRCLFQYIVETEGGHHIGDVASEQFYVFTIPGIYRYGTHVFDPFLYDQMLLTYESFQGNLLVSSVTNNVNPFDFTYAIAHANHTFTDMIGYGLITASELASITGLPPSTVNWTYNGYQLNIKGIELLKRCQKINLNGINILSLEVYDSDNVALNELILSNCSLNDADVRGTRPIRPLYYLQRLDKLDLSSNALTNGIFVTNWVYRTLKTLNVNSNNFYSIKGITTIVYLEDFSCEHNNIQSFDPLLRVASLKNVWVGYNTGNTTYRDLELTGYLFGDHGYVNIPIYVYLTFYRFVNVYINAYKSGAWSVRLVENAPVSGADPLDSIKGQGYQISEILRQICFNSTSFFIMDNYYVPTTTTQIDLIEAYYNNFDASEIFGITLHGTIYSSSTINMASPTLHPTTLFTPLVVITGPSGYYYPQNGLLTPSGFGEFLCIFRIQEANSGQIAYRAMNFTVVQKS